MQSDLFGEIRSVFHSEANEQSFEQLCSLLERAEPDILESMFLPYVMSHLSEWLDIQRVMPWLWIDRALQGDRSVYALGSVAATLDLSGRHLRRDILSRIFKGLSLESVTHIYLERCQVGPSMLTLLGNFEGFQDVDVLGLAKNPLSSDGLRALLEAPAFSQIHVLDLERCMLRAEDIQRLLASPLAAHLEELELGANSLDVMALTEIGKSSVSQRLRRLGLTSCVDPRSSQYDNMGGDMLGALVSGDQEWHCLTQLELGWWGLRPQDMKFFRHHMFAHLEVLDLQGCSIRSEGAKILSECDALGAVRVLDLKRNMIGDEGVLALTDPTSRLTSLRDIYLAWNAVSEDVLKQLEARGVRAIMK